ncbi:MAG: fumarate hydratase [Spirochaetales bacterium]|uniref:Fumarate hydratase n=1 Tax=Candidatus Thalassospirochaeta sargassi TaxID=3119039 RepID=A0AAJ1MK37_9SPIO|nr:fumarate hydratase [Spirochaetales bacterium]
MRKINYKTVVEAVEALCLKAAYELPEDVENVIKESLAVEESPLGKSILKQYLENADIARNKRIPICQDTGAAVFLAEVGTDCFIEGGSLTDAVKQGTAAGYKNGYLRKSMVEDPIFDRKNTGDNTPVIVHLLETEGDILKLTLAPKGGGSENMSKTAMLKPLEGEQGVIDFVVKTVTESGANPCPPTIVGVGIGGDFEYAAFLAKKALFRRTGEPHPDPRYAEMEHKILKAVNESGVGPQGLGGRTTAFAVHIEKTGCHIASLPVAVNLNCHAARHASVSI